MAASKKPRSLTAEEIERWRLKFRALSNRARYDEAHALARRLMKEHPDVMLFRYMEAVMTAEEDVGYTPAELAARYRSAARKLRALLCRARSLTPGLRYSARNEYYWFSKQPYKQYLLGQERVRNGDKFAHYSQGVGAAELAKKYALAGKPGLCRRWARRSEACWLKYFRVRPDWFNSYLFYAAALGYQGRLEEMDEAYATAARIAGKPKGWKAIRQYRGEVLAAYAKLPLN